MTDDEPAFPTVIQLSEPFVDEIGAQKLDEVVADLVDLGRRSVGRPTDEVADALTDRLIRRGVDMPEPVVARISETLSVSGDRLAIILDDHTVLHGSPDLTGRHASPSDPESPDRPPGI